MPIYLNNKSYTLAIGNTPIEKLGGEEKVTFSMYGEEPPMKGDNDINITFEYMPEDAILMVNGKEIR
jgi:hypothetical protein